MSLKMIKDGITESINQYQLINQSINQSINQGKELDAQTLILIP